MRFCKPTWNKGTILCRNISFNLPNELKHHHHWTLHKDNWKSQNTLMFLEFPCQFCWLNVAPAIETSLVQHMHPSNVFKWLSKISCGLNVSTLRPIRIICKGFPSASAPSQ